MSKHPEASRARRFGERATLALGLALAFSAVVTTPQGLPAGGWSKWLAVACLGGALGFAVAALWALLSPPNGGEKIYRFPRRSGTIHDIDWIEHSLRRIGIDRASRSQKVEDRIKLYLMDLLSAASRATIVTNDLSWAELDDGPLSRLSSQKNLTLIGFSSNYQGAKSEKLEKFRAIGADVFYVGFDSEIRLTLMDRSGSQLLAVGHRSHADRKHRILYVSDHDDPMYGLALSLIKCAKETSQ
jgi:hypothetical protein